MWWSCAGWNSLGRLCVEAIAGDSPWVWAGRGEGCVEVTLEHPSEPDLKLT